jgi:hypothetical protein
MAAPPPATRFLLVVSSPPNEADTAAMNIIRTGSPYFQSLVSLASPSTPTETPFLVDQGANNTKTTVADTHATLHKLAAAAAKAGPSAPKGADAQAAARAALLSQKHGLSGPAQPAAARYSAPPQVPTSTAPFQAASRLSPAAGGFSQPQQPQAAAARTPGPPAGSVVNSGPGFEVLASPTAGLGIPGGANSLSRSNGGPSIGMGFAQAGNPAAAGITITEDQSRSMLDRMFDVKGVNTAPVSGHAPQQAAAASMVSVEKLIPPINEKEALHERLPDISELEARREQEFAEVQSRRHRAPATPQYSTPF